MKQSLVKTFQLKVVRRALIAKTIISIIILSGAYLLLGYTKPLPEDHKQAIDNSKLEYKDQLIQNANQINIPLIEEII